MTANKGRHCVIIRPDMLERSLEGSKIKNAVSLIMIPLVFLLACQTTKMGNASSTDAELPSFVLAESKPCDLTSPGGVGRETLRAQSFVPTSSGRINSIRLKGNYDTKQQVEDDFIISVYRNAGGNPNSGDLLFSQRFRLGDTRFPFPYASDNSTEYTFDMSGSAADLVEGESYWLVLGATSNYVNISFCTVAGEDAYKYGFVRFFNGSEWIDQPDDDLFFSISQ